VAAVGVLHQFTVVTADGDGFPTVGQVDGSFGTVVDRARLIEGSEPDQSKVDEVAIGEALAEELGLRVGDELEIIGYSSEDVDAPAGVAEPHGPRVPLRIVGIVRRPLDLGGRGAVGGVVVLTRAFTDEYRDRIGSYVGTVLRVRAERGADGVAGIGQVARRIFGDNERFSLTGLAIEGAVAQNAVDVTTVGLLIAAGVAALTSIVGIGIALARVIALADVEQPTLAALGARRRTRALAAGAVALPIAVVGACLAVVGAVLASPLFPIGVAADAEPDPGVDLDGVTLLVGFVLVAVVVLAIAAVTARRTARVGTDVRERVRPGYAVRVASDAGFPPPVAAGIRFALDRSRVRPSLPVRSSLLGAAMGVVVIVAAMVYVAGLDHLVSTPAAYGWTWDTAVGDAEAVAAGDDCGVVNTRLTGVDGLGAITAICNGALEVDGRPVIGWAYRRVSGEPIGPAIVEGRPPATSTEVVLGRDTLVEIGKEIGDRVRIAGSERARIFRIVGTSAFPVVSDTQALAEGAVLTVAGLRSTGRVSDGWNLVARFASGADRGEVRAEVRQLAAGTGDGDPIARRSVAPTEIDHVRRIDGLPLALAAFVAAVALVAVGFALVSAGRRRRRELAVMRTIGFLGRQLRAVLAWQATTVALIGLIVGVPIGLVIGRLVWSTVADDLGVASTPTWPVLGVVLLVPAVLLAVNVVAALPARAAARTRPAVVLRSE
jgi:hypothetical protein